LMSPFRFDFISHYFLRLRHYFIFAFQFSPLFLRLCAA
jgi:hypothetical protein